MENQRDTYSHDGDMTAYLSIDASPAVADQLQSAFRLIQTAFQLHRKTAYEEITELRKKYENLKGQNISLQKRYAEIESHNLTLSQNHNLLKDEHKRLFSFCESLQRKINKLETLRNAVLSTIQGEDDDAIENTSKVFHSSFTMVPAGDPPFCNTRGSPTEYGNLNVSIHDVSPQNVELSPPSRMAKEMSVTSGDECNRVGKQFFRNAKGRMSTEAFAELISLVKHLNRGETTTTEVLDQCERIFTRDQHDLCDEFKSLLHLRLEKENACR